MVTEDENRPPEKYWKKESCLVGPAREKGGECMSRGRGRKSLQLSKKIRGKKYHYDIGQGRCSKGLASW